MQSSGPEAALASILSQISSATAEVLGMKRAAAKARPPQRTGRGENLAGVPNILWQFERQASSCNVLSHDGHAVS